MEHAICPRTSAFGQKRTFEHGFFLTLQDPRIVHPPTVVQSSGE